MDYVKRFYGDTLRCPNAPYYIIDKATHERVKTFKHDELPYGYETLNSIVDLLNKTYSQSGKDKQISLDCEDISSLEDLVYFLEHYTDLLFKDEKELKEIYTGEYNDKDIFSTYLIFKEIRMLLPLIHKLIFDDYYNGEEVKIKIKAQEELCDDWNVPYFAPDDGWCVNCNKQIYRGLTLKECREEHITHCPYCSYAYND